MTILLCALRRASLMTNQAGSSFSFELPTLVIKPQARPNSASETVTENSDPSCKVSVSPTFGVAPVSLIWQLPRFKTKKSKLLLGSALATKRMLAAVLAFFFMGGFSNSPRFCPGWQYNMEA